MQSKPEVKNVQVTETEEQNGKHVFSVNEAKEWLQAANINVKNDSRLTNIGSLMVIWMCVFELEVLYFLRSIVLFLQQILPGFAFRFIL